MSRSRQLELDLDREVFTPAQLGELLGDVPHRQVLDWCRAYDWPCLRFGRTIRFTREHVRQIVAAHQSTRTASSSTSTVVTIAGQTKRSASRSA